MGRGLRRKRRGIDDRTELEAGAEEEDALRNGMPSPGLPDEPVTVDLPQFAALMEEVHINNPTFQPHSCRRLPRIWLPAVVHVVSRMGNSAMLLAQIICRNVPSGQPRDVTSILMICCPCIVSTAN